MARSAGARAQRAAETRPGPCFRGSVAATTLVLWARGCPPGPLFPGAYKYPLGSEGRDIQRRELYFVASLGVVVVVLLLVLVLTIRVKERECKICL